MSVNWRIPFFDMQLDAEDRQAVMAVLERNWLTAGPETAAFETEFAEICGAEAGHAVAVTNCTAGLHLALAGLGVGAGDEVICPSLTFVATANAPLYVQARPVFADICSETDWNIDPDDVSAKITDKTKAVIVVHYGGHACDMDEIMDIAAGHGLLVIEDASHAPLASWRGQPLGTIGDAGCFSFYSNKNMTTGEGGMVVCRDEDTAARIRLLRSHAMTSSSFERFQGHAFGYDVEALGFNYRIDEMRAALGRMQLRKLRAATEARRQLSAIYAAKLGKTLPQVGLSFQDRDLDASACHIFPVSLPSDGPARGTVMERLSALGIQTSIHYRPVHQLSVFKGAACLPMTECLAPSILTLPLYPHLGEDGVAAVVNGLSDSLRTH